MLHAAFVVIQVVASASDASAQKLAVLPTQFDKSAEGRVPDLFDDYLLTAIQNISEQQVIGQDDISAMLGFEKQKEVFGCDDTTCLAEIGGALGVDQLVATKIARLREDWVVTSKLIDLHKTRVEARSSDFVNGDVTDLLKAVPQIVRKLLGGGGTATIAPSSGTSDAPAASHKPPASEFGLSQELASLIRNVGAATATTPRVARLHEELLLARQRGRDLTGAGSVLTEQRDACDSDPQACVNAATIYDLGLGVERNTARAIDWYENACRQGLAEGCDGTVATSVAVLHRGNEEQAHTILQDPCLNGNGYACVALSQMDALSLIGRTQRKWGIILGIGGLGLGALGVLGTIGGGGLDGIVVAGAGVVVLAGGIVLYIIGRNRLSKAEEQMASVTVGSTPAEQSAVTLELVPLADARGSLAGFGLGVRW